MQFAILGTQVEKLDLLGQEVLLILLMFLQKNDEIFKSEGLEVDYFVHSWSLEFEDKIKKLIEPKSFVFENYNKKIIKPFESFGLLHFNSYVQNCLSANTKNRMESLLVASQYRWYSNSTDKFNE